MSPGDNRRNSSSLGEQNFGPNDGQLSTTNEYIQELSRQNNQLRHHHLQQQQQQHQQALQLLQLQQQQQQQQFTTPVIYTLPHHTTQTQIFLQQPYTVSQPAAILQTGLASTLPHQQQIFATGIGATPLNNNIILNMTPQLSHLTAPALGLTNQIAPSPHYSADGSAPALRQVLLSQQNENLILEQQLEALQEKKEALQKLKDLHNKGKSESKKEEKKSAKAEANQNLPKLNEQFTVKNLKPRRKPYSFGVPTDIDEIVLLASSLVAQEVRDCHFGFSGGQQQEIEDRAVNAAAALEAFASDVILPNLQASYAKSKEVENLHDKKDTYHSKASSSKNKSCISKDKGQRILVAALLALREVLMMNAERIFGPNFAKQSTNDANNDESCSKNIQKSESYVMKIQTFSTSIILNAICNLPKLESDEITKQFLQASSKYDERDQEFASCLKRMDVRAVGTLPNGRLLKRHENLQFKVSYNVGRLEHPLIKEQLYRVRRIRSNAAYVCILDDQQGLKHPKQKLRAKNAIQKCRKETAKI
ncbi:hypothetical protein CTEN210_02428 [Chaetoceros tenuissimus]|uniref:Uncharacterized protein n=1 Tax=Chaetoceros tenuissimus TaxID=426638 RepID=A0AAD3CHX3_9STRA|nr:hypothetical protein CTEN210_02428 [Chaetoceros tenuissimus]